MGKELQGTAGMTASPRAASKNLHQKTLDRTMTKNVFHRAAPVETTEPMSENALREAFSIFDVDDDGLITAKELKSIMEQMGNPLTDAEVKDIIAEAGSRKTNSITFAQFAKLMHIGARGQQDDEEEIVRSAF